MTDVIVGLLFVVIILLVYFAYQLTQQEPKDPDVVPRWEYEELEVKLLELDKKYIDLTVLYWEVHKENIVLKDEIKKLIAEIESVKNRIQLLEEENVTLKMTNKLLTEENNRLNELIKELIKNDDYLQSLIAELEKLSEEIALLKIKLAKLLDENEQLKTRIAELEELSAENERLKIKLADLLEKNEQLKTRIAELEELSAENERLKIKLEKLLEQNKRLRIKVAQLLIENEQLKTQIEGSEELSEENERLKSLIAQLKDQIRNDQGPLEIYLTGVDDTRATILKEIKRYIDTDPKYGERGQANVEIDTTQGILRLPEGILFERSKFELLQQSSAEKNAALLADAFADILPCYTLRKNEGSGICGDVEYRRCNPNKAFIDVIYVEGHTDSVQVDRVLKSEILTSGDHCCGSKYKTDNLRLSSRRATNTLTKIFEKKIVLKDFVNPLEEEVFGAASWGMRRPVILKELIQPMPHVDITRVRKDVPEEEQHAANRRIDVRLLMHTVTSLNALRDFMGQLHSCYAPN